MKLGKIGIKIWDLQYEARDELYTMLDKNYKKMPKDKDGKIDPTAYGLVDNDIDALRHSYVSAVYVIEYGEDTAELLGRLREYFTISPNELNSLNMDLWNNSVGRKYGKKFQRGEELFDALLKALKNGELIIDPKDPRKYRGEASIKRVPKDFVIKIRETNTGANIEFFDIHKKIIMTREHFVAAIKDENYPNYSFKTVNGEEIPVSKRDRFKFNNLG